GRVEKPRLLVALGSAGGPLRDRAGRRPRRRLDSRLPSRPRHRADPERRRGEGASVRAARPGAVRPRRAGCRQDRLRHRYPGPHRYSHGLLRIVLFTNDQPVIPEPLKKMPEPSPSRATLTRWQPGRMTVTLDPVPAQPSYLLIAENWYPDWQATADGQPEQAEQGDSDLQTLAQLVSPHLRPYKNEEHTS